MHYTEAERETAFVYSRASVAAFATGKQFALDALHQAHHHQSALCECVCVCDLLVVNGIDPLRRRRVRWIPIAL
jgi:hypothetical protein